VRLANSTSLPVFVALILFVPALEILPKVITKEVIKEVPIEKVMWDEKKEAEMENLRTENNKLKKELDKITDTLEKMNKAKYLKGSDLNNLYGE
jgi:cell division protein FtsB